MKIAIGPNAHGMEVYERLVIDPKGNLVRLPWDTKLKEGWVEATAEDLQVAETAQRERQDKERQAAEKAQAERSAQAAASAEGGPIVRVRQDLDDRLDPGTTDARPVPGHDQGTTLTTGSSGPLATGPGNTIVSGSHASDKGRK